MARVITERVHLIQECYDIQIIKDELHDGDPPDWYKPGSDTHIPQNAYFIDGEETLLFDTLSPLSTDQILDDLDGLLGDDNLDYLVLSHTDTPHCANTMEILDSYPEVTLVAPAYGQPEDLYYLDDAQEVVEGDTIDLGSFEVKFIDAPFLDDAKTIWMFERETRTLFTVDWLNFPHNDDECGLFLDELERPVSLERLEEFHGRVFHWWQYVDLSKVLPMIDYLIDTYDPDIVASAHGNVIREDPAKYMRRMENVVEQIRTDGRMSIV